MPLIIMQASTMQACTPCDTQCLRRAALGTEGASVLPAAAPQDWVLGLGVQGGGTQRGAGSLHPVET